jgi:curli biogenesis system outer membrane secretion channel CsgG
MKKLSTIALIALLTVGMVACKQESVTETSATETVTTETATMSVPEVSSDVPVSTETSDTTTDGTAIQSTTDVPPAGTTDPAATATDGSVNPPAQQ